MSRIRPVRPPEERSVLGIAGAPLTPTRLRELPGVAEIETALHVPGWHLLKEYDDLHERINQLSISLFGIAPAETKMSVGFDDWEIHETPTNLGLLTTAAAERLEKWELAFDFLDYEYDEEAETFWLAFGWDVTDGAGRELAIMEFLGRPLTCVLKRMHSRARFMLPEDPAPTASNADVVREADEWGAKLAEEARRFKPRR